MKKILLLILITLSCSSCSFLPRLTLDTPGTAPQSVDKSKAKEVCKGQTTFNEYGDMTSCTRGYVNYTQNYEKKERKYTFGEKIGNFFRKLSFWAIILLALGIFFPVLGLGTFIGKFIEGTFGIGKQVMSGVARGIQRVRKNGDDINIALDSELDEKHKQYIKKLKNKENIK